jgi:hypothetical protein
MNMTKRQFSSGGTSSAGFMLKAGLGGAAALGLTMLNFKAASEWKTAQRTQQLSSFNPIVK